MKARWHVTFSGQVLPPACRAARRPVSMRVLPACAGGRSRRRGSSAGSRSSCSSRRGRRRLACASAPAPVRRARTSPRRRRSQSTGRSTSPGCAFRPAATRISTHAMLILPLAGGQMGLKRGALSEPLGPVGSGSIARVHARVLDAPGMYRAIYGRFQASTGILPSHA